MHNQNLGKLGEEIATEYLRKQGYQILQRNFKAKYGEIDIICLEKTTLVFVEVKTRWSKEFGEPEEAVTRWKIGSITRTGQYYSLLHPDLPELLRIDVVGIMMDANGKVERLTLTKNVTG